MRSRSSTNCRSFDRLNAERFTLRLGLLIVVLFGVLALRPTGVMCAPNSVDRRVSAIPARILLTAPLDRLIDRRRQLVSQRLRRYDRPLFIVWALSQIAAFFALWTGGYAARLRDAVRRRVRYIFAVRFVFGALLAYIAGVASFPAAFAHWRIDLALGTALETTAGWVRDGFVNATVDAVVVGLVVAAIFALVDRTRVWWIYATIGLFVVTLLLAFIEPITVAPLYNRIRPLALHASIRRPLDALAKRAGIVGAPLEVSDTSRRSRAISADIAGFGTTKRIVLGDELLADATQGEVLFLAAREFGHYAHGDDFRLSLFWTFLFIIATALAVLIADRIPFRRDDDSLARLPLVFAFMGIGGLVLTPVYNGYSRNLESRADAYGLALTENRSAAVRAYVRIADETLAPLCPSRAVRLYFYNSPPLGTRIAKAAQHPNPCP